MNFDETFNSIFVQKKPFEQKPVVQELPPKPPVQVQDKPAQVQVRS